MLNMDPTRLPSYLRQASESELATLAQQARDPKIIVAVQDEMERRQGGLMSQDMAPPPQQMAQPLPQPTQLAEVATEGWVPPWQRNDGTGPFPALVREGPTADRSPMIPEDPWLRGARERMRPDIGTPYGAQLQAEGPVPEWEPDVGDDLPTVDVGERPVFDADAADDLDIPPEAIEIAQALEEAGDNPDAVQALLAELQGSIQSPEDMRNMAIARAGFGMAASQNPYFFGALGEGANQGLDAYEKARQEAFMNRVRSADLQQDQAKFGEQRRATGVAEKSDAEKLKLTERNVVLAERDYERKVREYEEGKAGDAELKAAEIALRRAQAAYYAERPTTTVKPDYFSDKEGNLFTVDGGKAVYVTDEEGNRTSGSKAGASGSTAFMRNAQGVADTLFGGDLARGIAFLKSGSTMSPDQRLKTAMSVATDMANSDLILSSDPIKRQRFIDEKTAEIERELASAAAGSTGVGAASPGPAAPTAGAVSPEEAVGGAMPAPKTPEEYDALPPGTTYLHPDGKTKVKKARE